MFEKNLNDLVRGLRNNKNNEAKFVTECLDEIKQELRQENMAMKANAVLKLSYIQMLGYDISWAAFNIIEVMSSPKFIHKRIAYMAASQCFHSDLDVLMLATNLIKKDMNSQNQYDSGSAMVGLSCFVSPDLARDLANDIMSMMVSSKPYVRKRAILLMYKVFLNFPEALRPAFPRLKERLEDPDQGVQCAAVNVICELARKNPKNYLALAPLFFKLMTTSSNNWMLIKIIKLFGALCPLEPRLGKKLLEPLTSLIHRSASDIKKCRQEREFVKAAKKMLDVKGKNTNGVIPHNDSPSNSPKHRPNGVAYCVTGISTSAMSLLYECINTVIAGLPDHQPSMQLCVSKLRLLIEDQDQNLKYLGLLLLNKILKAQPKIVVGHKDLILQCLDDRDESIRYRALDLIVGMISKKTLVDIIKKLMVHMEKAEGSNYRDELLAKIIEMCSQSNFQYITNFEWYIDVLLQLSAVEGTKHGRLIANQMLDVAIRVKAVRKYAVPVFSSLLAKPSLMTSTNDKNTSAEVLFAAAWVAGEYAEFLTDIHTTVASLSNPKVTSLPAHIQCVYIQAIGKLFSRVLSKAESEEGDEEEINTMSESLIAALPVFTQSSDLEVQDRSCCVLQLIKLVTKMKKEGIKCAEDVKALFAEELLPVAPKAQKKVPVPEGLDLDKWINEPLSEDESDDDESKLYFTEGGTAAAGPLGSTASSQKEKYYEPDEEELERAREIRRMFQESNPHYLKGATTNKKADDSITSNGQGNDVSDIPVKELDLGVSLKIQGDKGRKGKKKGRKGKKGRQASESEDEPSGPSYEVAPVIDLAGEENVDNDAANDDPHRALNIDLDTPLGDDEVLPVQSHRVVSEKSPEPAPSEKKKSKKTKGAKEGKKRTKSKDGDTENDKSSKKEKSGKKTKKRSSSTSKEKTQKKKEESEAERKATLLKLASQAASESPAKQKKEGDDMDFWLSPTAPVPEENALDTSDSKENTIPPSNVQVKEEGEKSISEPTEKKAKKKSKKEKGEKVKKKKSKKNVKDGEPSEQVNQDTPSEMMILDMEESHQDPYAHYNDLCKDSNIQLLYEVRCNPLQNTQVICSTIFRNLTSNHIQKLEFNVLDSLNMKLVRQVGASSHDPVLVPFQLLPDMTNEGQFAFNIESVVMSQYLRGTLTYILKESDGSSTSEKLDFRLSFPVSSFFHPRSISSDEFTSLLASGELKEKQSLKLQVEKTLDEITMLLCKSLRFTVVEKIEGGVSLYGETVQKHAVCLLLKQIDESNVSVDGKSIDFQLLSSVVKEIKTILEEQ